MLDRLLRWGLWFTLECDASSSGMVVLMSQFNRPSVGAKLSGTTVLMSQSNRSGVACELNGVTVLMFQSNRLSFIFFLTVIFQGCSIIFFFYINRNKKIGSRFLVGVFRLCDVLPLTSPHPWRASWS